jgi:hypothetical protein
MREKVNTPQVIWTGPITERYRDKSLPGYRGTGMDVYTRNTPDGKPQLRHLDTWGDVARHCKENGLVDPRSMGKNMTVSEDGKTLSQDKGMPGGEL